MPEPVVDDFVRKMLMTSPQNLCLGLAALLLGTLPVHGRIMTMPDGVRLEILDTGNQNWPRQAMLYMEPPTVKEWTAVELAAPPLVDDAESLCGKSLPLQKGKPLTWKATFPKASVYQVALYAKAAPGKDPTRDRTFLTLKVGDAQPILMQVNFRDKYACMAQFAFRVSAPATMDLALAVTPDSLTEFQVERIRLIDQFGNCAGKAVKTKQVLYTPDEIAVLRRDSKTPKAPTLTPQQWQARYEQIWQMPPSPYLPLMVANYNLPENNPRTGKKADWDLYPMGAVRKVSRTQVMDRKTGEVFPNKDFPDNGWGWISDADRAAGNWNDGTYHFVAWHNTASHVYQQGIDSWPHLYEYVLDAAQKYHETGDPGYGREAAVMMAALAYTYPLIMYNSTSRDNLYTPTRWTIFLKGGAWWLGNWQNDNMAKLAVAYERIFPFLYPTAPDDVVQFLAGKAPTIKTGEDVRSLIETSILQYSADNAIRRHYLATNGIWEDCLATYAVVQQDPATVRPWLRELWTRIYYGINEGGLPDMITNANMREGANLIGQANYAKATALLARTAFNLRRWVQSGGDPAYDIADVARYPKVLASCFFSLDIRAAGGFQTNIGEGYNQAETAVRPYPDKEDEGSRTACRLAYDATGDARCAWYLRATGRQGESDALWKKIEDDAQRGGDPFLHTRTRQLPGFGLSVLESGSAETDLAKKAALIMLSSIRVGHAHADTLDVELFARGARIVPDIATRYSRIGYLTRGHNTVEIDDAPFVNMPLGNPDGTGWIDDLDDAGWIRFTQATGRAARQKQVSLYRRAAALVDVPGGAYFVDVFRAQGGKRHTWCFHTQYNKDFQSNLRPAPPAAGMKAYVEGVECMKASDFGVAPAVLTTDYTCAGGIAQGVAGPVRVRTRLFGAEGLPLAIGRENEKGKLYRNDRAIEFLFVRRDGENLRSRWLHLIEPYGEKPILTDARELPVADAENSAALCVTTADGRRDTLIYNDTGRPVEAGGLWTDARFACIAAGKSGAPESFYLYGGRELRFAGWKLSANDSPEAKVVSLDPLANTVSLDRPWPARMAGRFVSVGDPPHRTSFDIVSVDGPRLRLQGTPRVYQARVLKAEGRRVTTELQLVLRNADPDYYVGLAAANGDHTKWWTVTATPRDEKTVAEWAGKTMPTDVRWSLDCVVELDHEVTLADFPAVDGRPMIYLYDFGPGTVFRAPAAVSARRMEDGQFRISGNVEATLAAPEGKCTKWLSGQSTVGATDLTPLSK